MPQWANLNGLIVPERVTLAKRLEDAQRERTASGKFFSNFANTTSRAGLGYNKPANTIQFEMLRQAREQSLIDKIIIMARITQTQQMAKRVIVPGKQTGFLVVHENYADPNYKPDADVIRRCKEMERIIDNVNPDVHPNGFIDFASVAVDQELTYDRQCMVIAKDRTGAPIRYHLVDGTTVRPFVEVLMRYLESNKITNQDKAIRDIHRATGVDLTNAAYVQVVDGMPVASWTSDEMSVHISNPSVDINKWAYGAGSKLEQSIQGTSTWLNAWAYNDGLFNQDSPESLLMLYGDVDPVGLGAFQRQILDQSGTGDYQKIPVIQADEKFKAELVKIRELPKDLQFAEFLRMIIQLKTAAYRAHPSIVNFSIDKGAGGGMTVGNNSEDSIAQDAKEEGFQSILHGQASWITRVIVKPRYDDLVMIYDVDLEDESRRIDVLNKESGVGMTFNEWRRARGLKGDLPNGDVPNNANYINAMQAMQGGPPNGAKPADTESTTADVQGKDENGNIQDPNKVEDNLKKHASDDKVLVIEIVN